MARRQKMAVDPATLEKYLPRYAILKAIVTAKANAYLKLIKAEKKARKALIISDEEHQTTLDNADALLADLCHLRQNATAKPLRIQEAEFKKLANKLANSFKRKPEVERPCFAEKSLKLIYAILSIVDREIEKLASTDQARFMRLVNGEERNFWITSNKAALTIGLNKVKLSEDLLFGTAEDRRNSKEFEGLASGMKGKGGYFASLLDAGFLLEKIDESRQFRLNINLDWLFGYSLIIAQNEEIAPNLGEISPVLDAEMPLENPFILPLTGENSTRLTLKEELLQSSSEKKTTGINGAAEPQQSSAPEGAQKKKTVEGKTSETPPQNQEKNGKSFAPREIFSAEKTGDVTDVPFKLSENLVFLCLKNLFNRQMMDAGRVKTGRDANPITEMRPSDFADMSKMMVALMVHARIDGENWTDTHERLAEGVQNTVRYFAEHPSRYIYPPLMWLNLTMREATLRYYHDTFLLPKAVEEAKNAAKTDDSTPPMTPSVSRHSVQILWFLEQGADPRRVANYTRKYSAETVTDAIRYAGATIKMKEKESNWKPEKGKIAYIFGVLANLNPDTIHQRAELAVAKAKGIAPDANVAAAQWTAEKIMKLAQSSLEHKHQKNRVTFAVCERISAHVISRKIDNETQIASWIHAIGEGRPTIFNKNEPPVEAGGSTQG